MKKLSVIIPVYNVEQWVQKCLESCTDRARAEEYEIIAVNDGSTDRSGAIVADYAARWPGLVRTVTTENGGLGHARNTGLSLAEGEYVAFVDSDDTLAPGAIGAMLDALDGSFDLAVFDFASVDEQGRRLGGTRGCAGEEGAFTLRERPQLLFEPPNACNKLYRRSLFLDSGTRYPDRLWFEDLAVTPKLLLRAGTIRYLPREWYRYLQRSGSILHNTNTERNREMIEVIGGVLDFYRAEGAYGRYEKELCYLAFYHELLTSTTRVCLSDAKSPVAKELREDFLARFPDFRENPYIRAMPRKYRLLTALILKGRYRAVRALMRVNEKATGIRHQALGNRH